MSLTHTIERVEAADPGFGLVKSEEYFFFNREALESSTSWFAMLEVFATPSKILISGSYIFFLIFLILLHKKNFNLRSLEWSFEAILKSIVAESFSPGNLNNPFIIWTISLHGAFIFWYFTSTLTSVLAVREQQIPIQKLDDLLHLSHFKLFTFGGGAMATYMDKWSKNNFEKQEVVKKLIEPNHLNSPDEYSEIVGFLLENPEPVGAILMSHSGFFEIIDVGKKLQ